MVLRTLSGEAEDGHALSVELRQPIANATCFASASIGAGKSHPLLHQCLIGWAADSGQDKDRGAIWKGVQSD